MKKNIDLRMHSSGDWIRQRLHSRRFPCGGLFVIPVFLLLTIFLAGVHAKVMYVNASAAGLNTGSNWTDAFVYLQSSLDAAHVGDQIWVAQGTYKPTLPFDGTDERYKTFRLIIGVKLYGGFSGVETNLEERDWKLNETILSGDLLGNDSNDIDDASGSRADNSFHVVSAFLDWVEEQTVLDGFTIAGGNADGTGTHANGGGIAFRDNDIVVQHCLFRKNRAAQKGGGAWIRGYFSQTITDCTFLENRARSGAGLATDFLTTPLGINRCVFRGNGGNESDSSGGGIYNAGYPSDGRNTVKAVDCLFENNWANTQGGGISSSLNQELSGCTFIANRSGTEGGAMANRGFSTRVRDCSFEMNTGRLGGGMYNKGTATTIQSCSFRMNTADAAGGGMYNDSNYDGSVTVTDSVFSDNQALGVSAWAGGGGMYNSNNSATLRRCRFVGNVALWDGGGIGNSHTRDLTIDQCLLQENTGDYGGGIYLGKNSFHTISRCAFLGNHAKKGGGIWAYYEFSLRNSVFVNNLASEEGGGAWIMTPSVSFCTFSGNHAPKGGGCYSGSSIFGFESFTDGILWQNSASEGAQVYVYPSSSVSLISNCIQGGPEVNGNIDADPLFIRNPSWGPDGLPGTGDDDYGDLRLRRGSPCIDAGRNSDVLQGEIDMEGWLRRRDGNCDGIKDPDMGAYEYDRVGDVNGDCRVDMGDLDIISREWLRNSCAGDMGWCTAADQTKDGQVNLDDLVLIVSGWMTDCTTDPTNPICQD
jgi:hypothetical protein